MSLLVLLILSMQEPDVIAIRLLMKTRLLDYVSLVQILILNAPLVFTISLDMKDNALHVLLGSQLSTQEGTVRVSVVQPIMQTVLPVMHQAVLPAMLPTQLT